MNTAWRRLPLVLLVLTLVPWQAAAAPVYTEDWETNTDGWSLSGSNIGLDCAKHQGSVGLCSLKVDATSNVHVTASTTSFSTSLSGTLTTSFFFQGSATDGNSDSGFHVLLDAGPALVLHMTCCTGSNNGVTLGDDQVFASWNANQWYEARIVVKHGTREWRGELYSGSGGFVGASAWRTYSSSASSITGLRIDGVRWGSPSNTFWYDTIAVSSDAAAPGAPRNLAATPSGGQITLTWDAPLSSGGTPITSYNVYRGTANNNLARVMSGGCANMGSDARSCTDGVGYGVTRYYQVSAVNSLGEGVLSGVVSATTPVLGSNPPATRCGFQSPPAAVLAESEVLPTEWTFASSSPYVSWQYAAPPVSGVSADGPGHVDPVRLWYAATNLSQSNYQAGALEDKPNNGTAVSPVLTAPTSFAPKLYFSSRYSVESRDPSTKDLMHVEASGDGGQTWAFLCKVNPSVAYGGTPDQTTCSNGQPNGIYPCPRDATGVPAPAWEARSIALPPGNGSPIQIRLRFDTVDGIQNSGLGWMVTDLRLGSS